MQSTTEEKSAREELREWVASNLPALQAQGAARMHMSINKYSIKLTASSRKGSSAVSAPLPSQRLSSGSLYGAELCGA
jgi:hypothetical protein